MARGEKSFVEYIEALDDASESSLEAYARSPAVAFLEQAVHSRNAIEYCMRTFGKKKDGNLTKDAQDTIYRISSATLASLMGHFETYQHFLFAGLLEGTRLMPDFEIDGCIGNLKKYGNLAVDLVRVSAFRGQPTPIGQILADNLNGWHYPQKVNSYFRAVVSDHDLYTKKEIRELEVLWQLRHSTVHTAGWLTQPDSQKVDALSKHGDHAIRLNYQFIPAVARRFHSIVDRSVRALEKKYRNNLNVELTEVEKVEIDDLFLVASPRNVWLPTRPSPTP